MTSVTTATTGDPGPAAGSSPGSRTMLDEGRDATGRGGPRRPGFVTAPFDRRTWLRYGYLWVALLMAPFALAYAILTVVLTAGLAVTLVGLFVGGIFVVGARGWASAYRGMAAAMLITEIPAPPDRRRVRGFFRRMGSLLGDAHGWRALLFMVVMFPLSIAGFVVSTTVLASAVGLITQWYWGRFLPEQEAADGTVHRAIQMGPDWYVDTPPRHLLVTALGVLLFFLWPWVNWLFTQVALLLSRSLLGPTRASLRVAELERSRAGTVQDADARLRRIERDLHDGTQARLVAVAMQLGEAKDQLDSGGDPDEIRDLIGTAHASTTDALGELRELARGIHPPVLDDGLAVALETLAARAPLPVTVDVDPGVGARGAVRPEVESIAYFCVAELVTNAAKHAGASGVYVLVERRDGDIRLRVRDDGRGGAAISRPTPAGDRSGLGGLAERVRSLDGSLTIDSPAGGPTVVTVLLPGSVGS